MTPGKRPRPRKRRPREVGRAGTLTGTTSATLRCCASATSVSRVVGGRTCVRIGALSAMMIGIMGMGMDTMGMMTDVG